MKITIIGSGDIAENGIIPIVGGISIQASQCDIRNYDSVLKIISENKPDLVICTAGVSHVSNILESNINDWKHEIDVNLIGSYHVAKASIHNNVKTMIFIASVAGLYGKPNHSGYSVSKSGVITLVQSLSKEGYHAYAISPGRVDTKMRERDFPNEDPKTRLSSKEIGRVVKEIIDNKHKPGDNIVIRKRGYRILRRIDRGSGWSEYLRVGEPPVI
jgi:NAD(P)-dependent dehydrogenase (short-subunit alcohol dehydrogenase family)